MSGLWKLFVRLANRLANGKGHSVEELARRLGLTLEELLGVQPTYRTFLLPKRSGGTRRIAAPDRELKAMQRRILRRLLGRLRCHPAAMGFERGRSIVTNARPHVGKAVLVQMDIKEFFPSTGQKRVYRYFRQIGWNREAADILVRLCTHEGGLPQGAPTSPRLSNLVNYRLDAYLTKVATSWIIGSRRRGKSLGQRNAGGTYTRYADDLTISFAVDDGRSVRYLMHLVEDMLEREGYQLHKLRKMHVRRRHTRQLVTGLVVNERVNLPRSVRRWLRAVEHRAANGGRASLSPVQLAGWGALQEMLNRQAGNTTR